MEEIKWTWNCLRENAERFHLNMKEFDRLKPFYDRMDLELFARCAGQDKLEFPLEEAQKAMGEEDLRSFLLLCIVSGYDQMVRLYHKNGYPDQMLEEISGDLRLWLDTLLRDFGNYGLPPRFFGWERSCLTGNIKSYGRLQGNDIHPFQSALSLYRNADGTLTVLPAFVRNNPPWPDLTQYDKTINIHIPALGPLREDDCIRSMKQMCEFSAKFHPDYDYRAIVCYSWLLDPQFQKLLPAESNIVRFQKLGHNNQLKHQDQTGEVRWRIWGTKYKDCPAEQLPMRNTMERNVAPYLAKGGKFVEGLLVIFRDELPALFKRIDPECRRV